METTMMPIEDLTEEDRFETSLTVCAVYLIYAGIELDEMEWANGTCTFYFHQSDLLTEEFAKFASGQARVEPQQFNNIFGQVVRRIRDVRTQSDDPWRRRTTT